jgi:hypothetical protein
MPTIRTLPAIDEDLIRVASSLATGADIHEVNTVIGIYRGATVGAQRLAAIIEEIGCREGDQEDLAGRCAASAEYERKLRALVAAARLRQVPGGGAGASLAASFPLARNPSFL